MAPRNPLPEVVARQELERLEGCVELEPEMVWILYRFFCRVVNILDEKGVGYRGHSLRESDYLNLLVVKATVEGEPVVCFINAGTSLNCLKIFLLKFEEDRLEWRHDKYA